MIIGGVLHFIMGYTKLLFGMAYLSPFLTASMEGMITIILGILNLCVGLIVWSQNPLATKLIAIIGIIACVAAVLFGFYLQIIILAPLYWYAIKWIGKDEPTEVHDWVPDWDKD